MMNSLRQHLSGSKDHHLRHHHHHHRHDKTSSISPLGGNRPIGGVSTEDLHVGGDKRRVRRSESTGGRSSKSSISSSHKVTGSHKSRSKHHAHEADIAPPRASPSPAVVDSSASSISSIGLSSSPPKTASSMGIVISEGRKRRDTDGSTTSTPFITATPPTPGPEPASARRSRSSTISIPASSSKVSPPYPVTPPVMNEPSSVSSDYIAYRPSSRSPSPLLPTIRPRSNTHPTSAPVELDATSPPKLPLKDIKRRNPKKEDPYTFLSAFDTLFLVDDSTSMLQHWEPTLNALSTVAEIAARYDTDGVDMHFLNSPLHLTNVASAAQVKELFSRVEPSGCTPTGSKLDKILRGYLQRYERGRDDVKPLNIVVLTDGEPTDDPESVIVAAARRLERLDAPLSQVGIQFLQIGDEKGAREALEELDDDLSAIWGVRDMVDTTRYWGTDGEMGGEAVLKALLGGVNRRWDRRGSEGDRARKMHRR